MAQPAAAAASFPFPSTAAMEAFLMSRRGLVAPPNHQFAPLAHEAPRDLQVWQALGQTEAEMHAAHMAAANAAAMAAAAAVGPSRDRSRSRERDAERAAQYEGAAAASSSTAAEGVAPAAAARGPGRSARHKDGDGFYVNPQGIHYRATDFKIYNSQYNVAHMIMKRAQECHVLQLVKMEAGRPVGAKFADINLMLLGPTYTELREQTRADLREFLHAKVELHSNVPFIRTRKAVDYVLDKRVINSSRLQPPRGPRVEQEWLTELKRNESNVLHLLVCDEAHWGIINNGVIDTFMQEIADAMDSLAVKPALLILRVSATSDVITRVVRGLQATSHQCVDWNQLRRHDATMRFAAPHYLPITSLDCWNDTNQQLLQMTTTAARAAFINSEYCAVLQQWVLRVFGPSFLRESQSARLISGWKMTGAYRALSCLFPRVDGQTDDVNQDEVFAPALVNMSSDQADYLSAVRDDYDGHGHMVLVRLPSNDEITAMVEWFQRVFDDITFKLRREGQMDSTSEFQPFEVLRITDNDPENPAPDQSLSAQLSPKAREYLRRERKHKDRDTVTPLQLTGLPCIVLVNFKMGMGERLPDSCRVFDVRARYIGAVGNMGSNAATFIQDIGRCAGHCKTAAEVLTCIKAPADPPLLIADIVRSFNKLHTHLHELAHAPTSVHPSAPTNSDTLARLRQWTIVLDAEPQIGKTGVVMALIDILLDNFVCKSVERERRDLARRPPNPPHPVADSDPALDLKTMTRTFADILNDTSASLSARVQCLKSLLGKNQRFETYHDMLSKLAAAQSLGQSVAQAVAGAARLAKAEYEGETPFRFGVADCGCGLHGVVVHLRRLLAQDAWIKRALHKVISVTGFDLHDAISALRLPADDQAVNGAAAAAAAAPPSPVAPLSAAPVPFIPVVGDMCCAHPAGTPFSAVVYCLSLFECDVSRHLCWAYENLSDGGQLIIADVPERFPDDFVDNMKLMGFVKLSQDEPIAFRLYIFTKITEKNDSAVMHIRNY